MIIFNFPINLPFLKICFVDDWLLLLVMSPYSICGCKLWKFNYNSTSKGGIVYIEQCRFTYQYKLSKTIFLNLPKVWFSRVWPLCTSRYLGYCYLGLRRMPRSCHGCQWRCSDVERGQIKKNNNAERDWLKQKHEKWGSEIFEEMKALPEQASSFLLPGKWIQTLSDRKCSHVVFWGLSYQGDGLRSLMRPHSAWLFMSVWPFSLSVSLSPLLFFLSASPTDSSVTGPLGWPRWSRLQGLSE